MRLAARTTLGVTVLVAAAALLAHDWKRELSYIYALDGKQHILSGGPLNIEQLVGISKRYEGRWFWFSLDGRSYVIRDAATLADIDRTFAPMRALEPQRDAIRHRLDPLERQESDIDDKLEVLEDSIEDQKLPEAKMRAAETRMRELEQQLRKLEEQMRVIEAEEERMDRRIEALEQEAERRLLPILRKAIKEGRAQKA